MKIIISLMGYKRSGKDTTAKFIKEYFEDKGYKVQIMHFASPLKQILSNTLNVSLEYIEKLKEMEDLKLIGGYSIRNMLQNMSQTIKKYDENFFVNALITDMLKSEAQIFIIPDLRFEVEYFGLLNIDEEEFGEYEYFNLLVDNPRIDISDPHISEREFMLIPYDEVIINDSSLEKLRKQAYMFSAMLFKDFL